MSLSSALDDLTPGWIIFLLVMTTIGTPYMVVVLFKHKSIHAYISDEDVNSFQPTSLNVSFTADKPFRIYIIGQTNYHMFSADYPSDTNFTVSLYSSNGTLLESIHIYRYYDSESTGKVKYNKRFKTRLEVGENYTLGYESAPGAIGLFDGVIGRCKNWVLNAAMAFARIPVIGWIYVAACWIYYLMVVSFIALAVFSVIDACKS